MALNTAVGLSAAVARHPRAPGPTGSRSRRSLSEHRRRRRRAAARAGRDRRPARCSAGFGSRPNDAGMFETGVGVMLFALAIIAVFLS